MNTKILIATHGKFAEGIFNSLEMICGTQKNIDILNAYVDSSIDYVKLIQNKVSKHNFDEESLIVITDLLGGSVNNEFMKYINDYPFLLIAGLNLNLLLEIVLRMNDVDIENIRKICDSSKNSIILCNDYIDNSIETDF